MQPNGLTTVNNEKTLLNFADYARYVYMERLS